MGASAQSLETLLAEINDGRSAQALPELDQMLVKHPGHPGLLTLRAEALRLTGRIDAAVDAFRQAGECGGGPRNWMIAGLLLASGRNIDESLICLRRALADTPDCEDVLDALITTYFNANRHAEGLEFARRQLALSHNTTYLTRAALLLQSVDLYEESTAAFGRILALAPDDPAIIGSALVPTRFTCDWELIEQLQGKISEWYERGDFAAPQEYPLTNLTWCPDEASNLGVTRAYVARMVGQGAPCAARAALPTAGRRIRIGYLSSDFRNHATMHLMAGLLEAHDRQRFEVFAYDYSNKDVSEYRQRFLDAVEHLVPIHSLTDQQAAERIADDRLDILFDLKLYTGSGRAGILTHRPAPVQVAYLGFPGSAASPFIDYIIADRFVTPDSSAPYYPEKFCRLPHSYQCNDRKRAGAADPGTRSRYGLPQHGIIFGVFNQSYKIDRGSFAVWMRVLHEVPDSVLWLLGQSEAARANLSRHAQLAGVDPARIIYAPFTDPKEHLARLQLADAVLDALVCNGHTTTSDALWAGVPVITARGRHFASRVSESLLNAMELPELVGNDADEMVRLARRFGTDEAYRNAVRAKVERNRLSAPLFDTARFTRDFEKGIEMMVERHRAGTSPDHMDVPDQGRVDSLAVKPAFVGRVSALQSAYAGCPLCAGQSTSLGFGNITPHPLWHEPLPPCIEWMRCTVCAHTHTRHHWSDSGRTELLRNARPEATLSPEIAARRRDTWINLVGKVTGLLGGYEAAVCREQKSIWVDVGCGDGSLLLIALDHGYAAVGLDSHSATAERVRNLGVNALANDFLTLDFQITPDVLTLLDILPQIADPRAALCKAAKVLRPGGVLVVSAPDTSSSAWRTREATNTNTQWLDPEQHHLFTRQHLTALLQECGFEIADVTLGTQAPPEMMICAVRSAVTRAARAQPYNGTAAAKQAYHVLQVRPAGYVHADALTEVAQAVYYGLKRLGLPVTFLEPALPASRAIIFGAHLLDADAVRAIPVEAIIFNSEQIDADSPWLTGPYMDALRTHQVWDYSAENAQRLAQRGVKGVQHVALGYLPELSRIAPAVEDIDVLFYGSLNPRRQVILEELQRRGLKVTALTGCYGEARDQYIARSKVVLNLHYYESKVFEIVRVSYLLSNFKAVVAECGTDTSIEPDLLQAMCAVPYDHLVDACVELLQNDSARQALAQRGHAVFSARPAEAALAAAIGIHQSGPLELPQCAGAPSAQPALPRTIQIGSGKDFRPEVLNLDINNAWGPDAVVDVAQDGVVNSVLDTNRFGRVTLQEDYFDCIIANDVLEHIPDLVSAMSNCLRLLRPGGRFEISVPYDLSLGAWQDPTHVRAFNENSWLYYTDWHWYLGWTEMRFDVSLLQYTPSPLGAQLLSSGTSQAELLRTPRAIDSVQVVLRKRYLQDSERRHAVARQPHHRH
jgi:predicted O-linked N-acetylglucosamine transferase (SPINDLY family)/SAM-dependent methyltransferase